MAGVPQYPLGTTQQPGIGIPKSTKPVSAPKPPGPSTKQAGNWQPTNPNTATGLYYSALPSLEDQRTAAFLKAAQEAQDAQDFMAAVAYGNQQQAMYGGGGYGGGGGGGGAVATPAILSAPNPYKWDTDPTYLSSTAAIDNDEATRVQGFRAHQDAVNRALADMLPKIDKRAADSGQQVKLNMVGRGLLRSGETDEMLAKVASSAEEQKADANKQTADSVADLEQQIAAARANAASARADMASKFATQYATAGS